MKQPRQLAAAAAAGLAVGLGSGAALDVAYEATITPNTLDEIAAGWAECAEVELDPAAFDACRIDVLAAAVGVE